MTSNAAPCRWCTPSRPRLIRFLVLDDNLALLASVDDLIDLAGIEVLYYRSNVRDVVRACCDFLSHEALPSCLWVLYVKCSQGEPAVKRLVGDDAIYFGELACRCR